LGTKRQAASIDYPRSRRMGGNPSTGCNRWLGVGASGSWTLEALGTHSPSLDSRCSAPCRSGGPEEFVAPGSADPLGGRLRASEMTRLVAGSVPPHCEQDTSKLARYRNRRDELAATLFDLRSPEADRVGGAESS